MRAYHIHIFLVFASLFNATAGLAQKSDAAPKLTVATVAGQPIYEDDLLTTVQGQLLPLRNQEYEIKKKALDSLIDQKLLEKAAKEENLTTEKLLAQEVDPKVQEPTDSEVEAYYLAQKDRLNRPLDDALKTQLRQSLKQAKIQQLRQDYIKGLRSQTKVAVLLSPPKIQVGYDPKRLRGNPKAPVMIIEFSDYQCPYCHQVEPTVKDLLAKYGDKVSLAYRDLPLRQIHPQAEIAAEASRRAEEQGKFWEYHDQLFTATKLDHDALVDYARTLRLDDKQFNSCLTSEKYKSGVDQGLREGMNAGITGTPGFLVYGALVSGWGT
jgi:protein-disulfide isomerase